MYEVLQVYTSFSYSLIDNFLSRSVKVGQALSFPPSPWSPAGLGYGRRRR